MIRGNRGAALVTTLLISMIVIAVSMLIASLVRQKIGVAREMKDGLQAAVSAENALQESLFLLSTHRFSGSGVTISDENGSRAWHFDNRPVGLGWGTVTVQDTNAVFPLWPFDPEKMRRLLTSRGIKESESRIFIDSLWDWMDVDDLKRLNGAEAMAYRQKGAGYVPRNQFWQCKEELRLVHGMTPEIWEVLENEMAPSMAYGLNPLTMRASLLSAMLGADASRLDQLLELREKGHLTYMNFLILFPEYADSMDIAFTPSRRLVIHAEGTEGDIRCNREMVVLFQEYRQTPFRIETVRTIPGSVG
jgi:type II secretory pathway component PulK